MTHEETMIAVRLAEVRLECLKLAQSMAIPGTSAESVIEIANKLMGYLYPT